MMSEGWADQSFGERPAHFYLRTGLLFFLIGIFSAIICSPSFAQSSDPSDPSIVEPISASLGKSCKGDSLELTINRWTQGDTPWCWATSAGTVMSYLGTTNAPCFIVDAVLRDKGELQDGIDCCNQAMRDNFANGCLQSGTAGQAFHSFLFDYKYRLVGGSTEPMKFDEVTEEICNDRPFISKVKSSGSSVGHTATVYGYVIDPTSTGQVAVHDPEDDNPVPWYVPYDIWFLSNVYGHIGDYLSICDLNRANCPVP